MKCIAYSQFGQASEVLFAQELSRPVPQTNEVLIKLSFSGVNPSDAKARLGNRPGISEPEFDLIIPNSDGSGIITSVGAKVDPSRVGEKVWVWNGQWERAFGTAAEFISLPSSQAVKIPNGMSLETGACLGIPGLTAAYCTLGDGSLKGKTILVSGGSGSVANIAIQLAKWSGATVVATGSKSNFEQIASAGADHIFNYNDPELPNKILRLFPT